MANTNTQRQKTILEKLQQQGETTIQSLADALGVSPMTVHRDLWRLESAGLVMKGHGSVTLASNRLTTPDKSCAMCGREISKRTAYTIMQTNGEQIHACCAHCGLMLQQQTSNIWQSLSTDFLHGHVVSTAQATFLIQNELTICCSPSILTFGSRQEAEKFQKGFGGQLGNLEETIASLNGMTHQNQ